MRPIDGSPPNSGLLILKSIHLTANRHMLGFTYESHSVVVVCIHFSEKKHYMMLLLKYLRTLLTMLDKLSMGATDCTRPDIIYVVGLLCWFTSKPIDENQHAIELVMR